MINRRLILGINRINRALIGDQSFWIRLIARAHNQSD